MRIFQRPPLSLVVIPEILSSHWSTPIWSRLICYTFYIQSDIVRLYGGDQAWLAILEDREEASCLHNYILKAYEPSYQRFAISLMAPFNMPGNYLWVYPNGSQGRDTKIQR